MELLGFNDIAGELRKLSESIPDNNNAKQIASDEAMYNEMMGKGDL